MVTAYVLPDDITGMPYDADKFNEDNPYSRMLDTFELRAPDPGDRRARDLSTIKNGRIEYERYLEVRDTGTLTIPWTISVHPDWDILDESDNITILTILGGDEGEYLIVSVEDMPPQVTGDEYFENYAELEADRFNKEAYGLIGCEVSHTDAWDVLDISYTLKPSPDGDAYIIYERLIPIENVLYRLRVLTDTQRDKFMGDTYREIIDSFQIRADVVPEITRRLSRNENALKKLRISKGDEPAAVENKKEQWASALPGEWIELDIRTARSMQIDAEGYYYLPTNANLVVLADNVADFIRLLNDDMELKERDIDVSGPEEAVFGDNNYQKYTYTRPSFSDPYNAVFGDLPYTGDIYVYSNKDDVYIIAFEISYIFDTPANRTGAEMFLTEFCAGEEYITRAESAKGDGANGDGAETDKPKKAGAVG